MNRLEQRLRKVAERVPEPPCNHPLGILMDPTDQEIEEAHRQLDNCPRCSGPDSGPGPKLVIICRKVIPSANGSNEQT